MGSYNLCLPTLCKNIQFKVKNDHRSKFSNLSNWKEEAWKNQGFNGIRTRDLRDTDTNWATKPHIGSEANLVSSWTH